MFAAGGTGGHIYPALALAHTLQERNPDCDIHFVGTSRGLENKILARENFPLHHIAIGQLNRNVGVVKRLITVLKLPLSFLQSLYLILRLRSEVVIGVGGYVSGPVLLMAKLLGRKTYIWEPNAYPGMANRILSKYVDESLVVYDEALKHLKTKSYFKVGMPVRDAIEKIEAQVRSPGEEFRILVFGGSQGARAVNTVVEKTVLAFQSRLVGVKVIHQTGVHDYARISSSYDGVSAAEALEYINDMEAKYEWADLVICRCGAGTLSELAACGKAAILVPLPSAADDHQRKNAQVLADAQAAIMVLQKDFTSEMLISLIERLRENPEELINFQKNVTRFHQPKAALKIADHILDVE